MSGLNRREALTVLGAVPVIAALPKRLRPPREDLPPHVRRAIEAAEKAVETGHYQALFFTDHEWRLATVLADMIIPADGRSGAASDAGTIEFIDFTVSDREYHQVPVRGGLRWIDTESRERFGTGFLEAGDAQRRAILDDIAYPDRAAPEHAAGVAFFNRFRDLVAMGFFTSKMGMEDLRYMGNAYVPGWDGCTDEACRHLGVSYE